MLQAIIQDEAIKNYFIAKNIVIEAVEKDIFHVLTEGNGNNYFCNPENFPNIFSKFQKDGKPVKSPGFLSVCRYFYRVESKSSRHEMTALDIFCGILNGYMWSPKTKSNGGKNVFYDNMTKVSPGDIVFSFYKTKGLRKQNLESGSFLNIFNKVLYKFSER